VTRDLGSARSCRQRLEAVERLLNGNRLDICLTMVVESQLAHIRCDLLTLLHEATEYPESLGDLERRTREGIEARRRELAAVGTVLRDVVDLAARRRLDHFQQLSRIKLAPHRRLIEGLLASHGDVLAEQPTLMPALH
jgi:hypothetical protein